MLGSKSTPAFLLSPSRDITWRLGFFAGFTFSVMLTFTLLLFIPHHDLFLRPTSSEHPRIVSRERMLEITSNAHQDLVYLPGPDILMMTMAKSGSTSTWNWLYMGLTGRPKFDMKACDTYVQDVRSDCWGEEAEHFKNLPEDEQWRVLTGKETLRVAIQRNPFDRLISSWKSKFACDAKLYKTDLRNRKRMVPALLRQAQMENDGKGCLTIEEFAEALERVQERVKTGTKWLSSLRKLDVHVRPQEFFFGEIDYDLVLDVADLGDGEKLKRIVERLPYAEFVKEGMGHRHASGGGDVIISETAARRIYRFAGESKPGETVY